MKTKKGFMDYRRYDTSNGYGSSRSWRAGFNERMTGEEAAEILNSQEKSAWEILEIPVNSVLAVIKKAYRAMMMKWHPDKNPDNVEKATEMSKKINAAYTFLTD